ncbi:MAG: right-handed parallel beta-helix repeat-containing protein [Chloroflexi bacterium]|nr:right-handed parallel beta-helix repeat-containing protein [Chloroflexota bacterium]
MKTLVQCAPLWLALIFFLGPLTLGAEGKHTAGSTPEFGLPPDGVPRPLSPYSTLWFQFQYRGDRTPIEIRLLDGLAPDIQFAVYTPELMEKIQRGEPHKPIGQMVRANGEPARDLSWAGKFPNSGKYYVAVQNPSALTRSIRLLAMGTAVEFPHTTGISNAEQPKQNQPAAAAQASRDVSAQPPASAMPAHLIANAVWVELPGYVGAASFSIPLTARPARCTPANAMPANVTRSVLLCPNETYAPFRVTGSNLTVYGDPTALVQGAPRGFGITVTGNNVAIVGVRVAAATQLTDVNTWLCLYEACTYDTIYQKGAVRGGIGYGGGILLQNNSNTAVIHSTVWGGTIGVASMRSTNNKIVGNNLSNLNGWGVYLMSANNTFVVNNTLNDVNRGCTGPDGFFYQSGCESAGFACAGCQHSIIVGNTCTRAGNCYYADGLGGIKSNANRFFNNYCAAASNNCFEVTYTQGNQFDYNIATADPATGTNCAYPFWISGSIVQFGKHNDWACTHSQKRAEEESKISTLEPTEVRGL